MGEPMHRRSFLTLLGGATAAWPMAARAQQAAVPVIGYIGAGTADAARDVLSAFYRGLVETGYAEGRNLSIEYRWAEDHLDRLPALAADLVERRVAAIVTLQSTASALAAKDATRTIPIVFQMGSDPVEVGLVTRLNRPGGNITGIYNLIAAVTAKRLELLHELVPAARLIAQLVNPTNAVFAESETKELQTAAGILGLRMLVLNATNQRGIDSGFAKLTDEGAGGLVVGGDLLFTNNPKQVIALAARYKVPAIYGRRDHAFAGGLMSYGTDFSDTYHQAGIYAGRILSGERPADLPVQQATKIQLVINIRTASALGITFPTALLVRADEVIE